MRRFLVILVGAIAPLAATAADAPASKTRQKQSSAAPAIAPKPDELRAENITDTEVREVQKIVAEHSPGEIQRIGPVTVGCNCGEQAACTDHVWIDLKAAKKFSSVLLARVKGSWQVSEMQSWQWRAANWQENVRQLGKVPKEDRAAYLEELERERQLIMTDAPRCPWVRPLYPLR